MCFGHVSTCVSQAYQDQTKGQTDPVMDGRTDYVVTSSIPVPDKTLSKYAQANNMMNNNNTALISKMIGMMKPMKKLQDKMCQIFTNNQDPQYTLKPWK